MNRPKIYTAPLRLAVVITFLATTVFISGCNQWTERGPKASGRVSAITSSDPNHLLAASPGGGVWKSQDGGASWNWAGNYGLDDYTALDLVKDRTDASQLFLRTWNGFWVSTDGAASWTRTLQGSGGDTSYLQPAVFCTGLVIDCAGTNPEFEPRPFTQIVFSTRLHKRASSIVFTALPCAGLEYSTNYGTSFTQVWPFPGDTPQLDPDNCITSIAADEVTGKVYIATMGYNFSGTGIGSYNTHIYRSTQAWGPTGPPNPLNWEVVNNGINSFRTATALAWGGSADRLMAVVTDESGQTMPYLFDGTTWTAKPLPTDNGNCFVDDVRSLVWGGGDDFFLGGITFAYTVDAGNNWMCPDKGNLYVDVRSIYPDRAHGLVWIGVDQSDLEGHYVMASFSWTPGVGLGAQNGNTGHGIATWQTYSVAAPPKSVANRNRLMAGAQDISTACSDDLGAHWQLLNLPVPIGAGDIQAVLWNDDGRGDVFYTTSTAGQIFRSTNAGSAATCNDIALTDITPPSLEFAFNSAHIMAVQPNNNNHIFLAYPHSIAYSLNGGTNWTSTSFSVSNNGITPVVTAVFADENGTLYLGTQDGGAFLCTDNIHYCDGSDGAGAWTPWGLNGGRETKSPRMITSIAESNPPSSPRNFWIGSTDGVYRQLAGETSWTLVQSTQGYPGTPPYVYNEVVVDPTCSTRIYAGIGYLEEMSRTRGGIVYSTDNGANWASLTSAFDPQNTPITQIVVDPANPYHVVASTYGRGVWDYFWATPGWGDLPLPACQ